ncbi:hypothetical protein SDC9_145028 [bioreactor metagenome]|uniref:Uncharacterized protein n=1 Tax=bioreactor metagenome TaxID=1076179 RepID=A0A645E9P0_9ZZZZ
MFDRCELQIRQTARGSEKQQAEWLQALGVQTHFSDHLIRNMQFFQGLGGAHELGTKTESAVPIPALAGKQQCGFRRRTGDGQIHIFRCEGVIIAFSRRTRQHRFPGQLSVHIVGRPAEIGDIPVAHRIDQTENRRLIRILQQIHHFAVGNDRPVRFQNIAAHDLGTEKIHSAGELKQVASHAQRRPVIAEAVMSGISEE